MAAINNQMPSTIQKWLNAINDADLEALTTLMSESHTFFVEGEEPTIGREANQRAWTGYFQGFPEYKISIDEYYQIKTAHLLIGHTTGSHVLAELESIPSSVLWRAMIENELVSEWTIYPANEVTRAKFGLPRHAT